MSSYYDQLIDEIREAAKRKPAESQHMPDAIVPNEWREKYPYGEYMISRRLSDWFGLNREMFPPADYWDAQQLEFMVQILTQLYWHFNYEPMMFHEHSNNPLPHTLAYETLIKGFDIVETYYADHSQSIYFCHNDLDTCPFGEEYCHCHNDD